MIPAEVTESILIQTKEYLGEGGLQTFVIYYKAEGKVNPILISGNVHYKEGKQIRDFLRTLPDCANWTAKDFDNLWSTIITILVKEIVSGKEHKPIKNCVSCRLKKWFYRWWNY
jgi:hypothetical protein